MNSDSVLDKIDQLPPEAKEKANDFVQYLYDQYVKSKPSKKPNQAISKNSFIGMWKDRDDLENSTAWVREQRENQWKKK